MIPQLPIEIVNLIIVHTVADFKPEYESFSERNKTLCLFTLVNSTWRGLALKELVRFLTIDDKNLDVISALLGGENGQVLRSGVKFIDFATSKDLPLHLLLIRPITVFTKSILSLYIDAPSIATLDSRTLWPSSKKSL